METWWSRVVSVLRGHIPWAECWSFEAIAGIRVVIMVHNFGAFVEQAPLRPALSVIPAFRVVICLARCRKGSPPSGQSFAPSSLRLDRRAIWPLQVPHPRRPAASPIAPWVAVQTAWARESGRSTPGSPPQNRPLGSRQFVCGQDHASIVMAP